MKARQLALKILIDIDLKGAFSNYSINKHLKEEISQRDKNLIREIVYGVIENRLYLDDIISRLSKREIEKINPIIMEILRMGVYQMIFMDRIPDSAAINEAVDLSKKHGHKGISGFVNGVLRNFSRNKAGLSKVVKRDPIDYISIKYSHPKWLVEKWVSEFGMEFTESLCKSNNSKAYMNIRVNRIKSNRNKLENALISYGYLVHKTKYSRDGLVITNPARVMTIKEFKDGNFIVQDESSMLVSQIANPVAGGLVLDLCSAPGGKATHMAEIMGNRGRIISRDIYVHRLKLIEDNSNRLGITIIETGIYNALELDKTLVGKVDYCIADVPCSGLGIIRRRPEIKWNRKEEDIKALKKMQIHMLNNAKHYLKPGGIIIYSTCTIGKEENLDIINEFLLGNKEFHLLGFEELLSSLYKIDTAKDGYIQLFPHIHGTDGFFIARIQKRDS